MVYKKKLIEVALPLEAINVASAREKSIRHGHPSTLHLWWARRPLAACRAVLFASLVDDPSEHPEQFPTELDQERERHRLFRIIEELVLWENSNNERVLGMAREEIMRSTGGNPPPVLDPFAGGGSIPLEAQRLGLEAHASDLNPVAVLINKALIEIPPKFANQPPVNPEARSRIGAQGQWRGAQGLAEDVRYYGKWMRDEAFKRIGHLYPKVQLPAEYGGGEATVIAWIWARTVQCPNPACGAQMPLVTNFALSTRPGKRAWVEPFVDRAQHPHVINFRVRTGNGDIPAPPKGGRGVSFHCIACGTLAAEQYIKEQGFELRFGTQLVAIVADGKHGRIYVPPDHYHSELALSALPQWGPEAPLSTHPQYMAPPRYGMTKHRHLFTSRQLLALTTLAELIVSVRERVTADALTVLQSALTPHNSDATTYTGYAEAIMTYLAFALDKSANYWSSVCSWHVSREIIVSTYGLPVLKMTWDFAEANPFSDSTGNWSLAVDQVAKGLDASIAEGKAYVQQLDATKLTLAKKPWLISTDPPYYDNVPYADLSDFFYVWLRHTIGPIYPELFSTMMVPKSDELVADQSRHGNRERARNFFEMGLVQTFTQLRLEDYQEYPLTVYYAFKQAESDEDSASISGNSNVSSTGWETMLQGLLKSGFQVLGTWPVRTEQPGGLRQAGRNALASSIVLVCRARPTDAPLTTRRDFLNTLKRELPIALKNLQHGNIAPVDLAQAAIGPGMAVFSRYSRVLESDGSPMRVRTALQLINQSLDQVLTEQEGDYDPDTRWAVAWFDENAHNEGPYGRAETLSKAKNISIEGLEKAGILVAGKNKARLLRRDELSAHWDPTTDKRLTVWEVTQHLIRALDEKGEEGAAAILRKVGGQGEVARDLAYRLYTTCERKKWAQEAQAYNSLVVAWPQITQLASSGQGEATQATFGG